MGVQGYGSWKFIFYANLMFKSDFVKIRLKRGITVEYFTWH